LSHLHAANTLEGKKRKRMKIRKSHVFLDKKIFFLFLIVLQLFVEMKVRQGAGRGGGNGIEIDMVCVHEIEWIK